MNATIKKIRRQVQAILDSNDLRPVEAGDRLSLRFASALVHLDFVQMGQQVVIAIRAPVLSGVDLGGGVQKRVLNVLNERNCELHFGKWALYKDTQVISLEYDLLGNHLQEEELMTAIALIARVADKEDDVLKAYLGTGWRAYEDS